MAGRNRRLVVAFGYQLASCGWAVTRDVVTYDIKRRLGEWESSFVGATGSLQQVIVVGSHEDGDDLRDTLNDAPEAERRTMVQERGLARWNVELLRDLLDAAFATRSEMSDLHRQELRDLAWMTVDARERKALEAIRKSLDALRTQLLALTLPRWDANAEFPFAAVIFDLDQTLVDSRQVDTPEAKRAWAKGDGSTGVRAFRARGGIELHDLPRHLAERGVKVAIVSRSPEQYVERVISQFAIHADIVKAGGQATKRRRSLTRRKDWECRQET